MALKHLADFEYMAAQLSDFPDDVRLEVLLAELIANEQIADSQFRVNHLGLFRRSYRKEIERVSVYRQEDAKTPKYLVFELWREGLYDSLPKGLFHNLRKDKKPKRLEKAKADVEHQAKEQKAARDFFAPIEQALFRFRIQMEHEEKTILGGFKAPALTRVLARQLWGLDLSNIPLSRAVPLLDFLPHAFQYKGDWKRLGPIFSFLLGAEVRLEQYGSSLVELKEPEQARLGQRHLGLDFVLGASFCDGVARLRISIIGLRAAQAVEYAPGLPQHELLDILCSFLLPIEAEVDVQLALQKNEQAFRLSESQTDANDYKPTFNNTLGYTTYLS